MRTVHLQFVDRFVGGDVGRLPARLEERCQRRRVHLLLGVAACRPRNDRFLRALAQVTGGEVPHEQGGDPSAVILCGSRIVYPERRGRPVEIPSLSNR